ncbi:hypothetical protein DPMN_053044 [Dreissena polymorpha]|uniref:DEAD/DEAH-box helicase domain-containing protein n=1 Tax=Dreissena polymorpha TaxID=45954 RepID=A0A9D4HPV0_DREPO|nr:hypothetical protein DPMN_053044 [Dreissena polymorpha]
MFFRVVELTGDVTPDMRAIAKADLIVTTPEKWDGVSRSWQTRSYVKAVSLIVIDEIHLLGTYQLNLCMLGNLSSAKMLSAEFLKSAFSLIFFKEYYQNSKQFGSR